MTIHLPGFRVFRPPLVLHDLHDEAVAGVELPIPAEASWPLGEHVGRSRVAFAIAPPEAARSCATGSVFRRLARGGRVFAELPRFPKF